MTVHNHRTVTDGDVKKMFEGKLADIERRVGEGTLPAEYVAQALQELTEGDFVLGGFLKHVGCLKLKAVKRFVVADHFKVGNEAGGRKIGWIGSNFKTHFGGVVEENVPAKTVYIWQLSKNSLDAPIIKIFGGDESPKVQTYLAHQFQMMEMGEKGKSRLDGWANLIYKLSPVDNGLWVPSWHVSGGEFGVGAGSSLRRGEWGEGYRVVCG